MHRRHYYGGPFGAPPPTEQNSVPMILGVIVCAVAAWWCFGPVDETTGSVKAMFSMTSSSNNAAGSEDTACEWGEWMDCNSSGEQLRPVTKGSCAAKYRKCEQAYEVQTQSSGGDASADRNAIAEAVSAKTGKPRSEIVVTEKASTGVSEPGVSTYVVKFKGSAPASFKTAEDLMDTSVLEARGLSVLGMSTTMQPPVENTAADNKTPVDCNVEWYDWGECQPDCSQSRSVRRIVQSAMNGGKPCPTATEEVRTCAEPCVKCSVEFPEWPECRQCGSVVTRTQVRKGSHCPTSQTLLTETKQCPPCGNGSAKSANVSSGVSTAAVTTAATSSNADDQDCAYEWSEWTPCPPCGANDEDNNNTRRTQSRTPQIQRVAKGAGRACPALETRECAACEASSAALASVGTKNERESRVEVAAVQARQAEQRANAAKREAANAEKQVSNLQKESAAATTPSQKAEIAKVDGQLAEVARQERRAAEASEELTAASNVALQRKGGNATAEDRANTAIETSNARAAKSNAEEVAAKKSAALNARKAQVYSEAVSGNSGVPPAAPADPTVATLEASSKQMQETNGKLAAQLREGSNADRMGAQVDIAKAQAAASQARAMAAESQANGALALSDRLGNAAAKSVAAAADGAPSLVSSEDVQRLKKAAADVGKANGQIARANGLKAAAVEKIRNIDASIDSQRKRAIAEANATALSSESAANAQILKTKAYNSMSEVSAKVLQRAGVNLPSSGSSAATTNNTVRAAEANEVAVLRKAGESIRASQARLNAKLETNQDATAERKNAQAEVAKAQADAASARANVTQARVDAAKFDGAAAEELKRKEQTNDAAQAAAKAAESSAKAAQQDRAATEKAMRDGSKASRANAAVAEQNALLKRQEAERRQAEAEAAEGAAERKA